MKPIAFICCLFFFGLSFAQEPHDSVAICPIPIVSNDFHQAGVPEGEVAPAFVLYGLNGDSLVLNPDRKLSKPLLLVNGSYTCPVFRNKINTIHQVLNDYGIGLDLAVIYTVEAHPDVDISPYSGTVWTTQTNVDENVLYRQARNYGERKATALAMVQGTSLEAAVFLDDPCNTWWETYGPAPNNAYLIDTNGLVFSKHGWFHRSPDDIFCDLDRLIAGDSCQTQGNGGIFQWQLLQSDTAWGNPRAILTIKGQLINTSTTESVEVGVYRLQNNLPNDWQSAMCIDICLDTDVDTSFFTIAPGDTQQYIQYFYTGDSPNQGHVRIGFRNLNQTSNQVAQNFFGRTDNLGINTQEGLEAYSYPNPVEDRLCWNIPPGQWNLYWFDLKGRRLGQESVQNGDCLDVSKLPSGCYYFQLIQAAEGQRINGKWMKK